MTLLRVAFAIVSVRLLAACAVAPPGPLPLNSERIEERFGSYGIEVLQSTASLRVSDLYSGAGATRVTRTFAVVQYPPTVPDELAAAHATILAGGSIGATLAAQGWQVEKHNRAFEHVRASPGLGRMMDIDERARLAVHVYVLEAVKGGARFDYAMIAEVHHPDYLSLRDVREIYGAVTALDASQRERVERMDADVAAAIARLTAN
jgi:hypothetical protein